MSSTEPDRILFIWTKKMEIPLFFLFLDVLITEALQNKIGFFWFIETDHFNLFGVDEPYGFREKNFADFTLEFGEVVSGGDPNNFLLDLTEHPIFETADMDELAAAFAFTRVD